MIGKKSANLFPIASNSLEYQRFKGIIDGSLKNGITVDQLNQELGVKAMESLKPKKGERLIIVDDVSDIRKPYTEQSEYLGKVRDLDGQLINGYQVMAGAVINPATKELRLLQITPFSNQDPHFITQQTLKKERKTLENEEYNQSSLIRKQIAETHQLFENQPLVHVIDRGFDDAELFQFIEDLGDEFVIRVKTNRKAASTEKQRPEWESKLLTKTFAHSQVLPLERFQHKNRKYTHVKLQLEWEFFPLSDAPLWVVRVQILDANGKPLFKQPMILVTNIEIRGVDQARIVYQYYLMRSRIELVFKFLKGELGWESFRQTEYIAIQNLLALVFFIGGYFFELEPELVKSPQIQFVCQLAQCKGHYTRFFYLKGLATIADYLIVHREIQNMTDFEKEEFLLIVKQHFPSYFS